MSIRGEAALSKPIETEDGKLGVCSWNVSGGRPGVGLLIPYSGKWGVPGENQQVMVMEPSEAIRLADWLRTQADACLG